MKSIYLIDSLRNPEVPKVAETQMRRAELIAKIRAASHAELARLWRFAPVGSFYFTDPIVWEEFARRFEGFGGMTPVVSKEIGWDG